MLDIKAMEADPESFKAGLRRRGYEPLANVDQAVASHFEWREAMNEAQTLREQRNRLSDEIAAATGETTMAMAQEKHDALQDLRKEAGALKKPLEKAERRAQGRGQARDHFLEMMPNLPAASVPDGDETNNRVLREWGERRAFAEPKSHVELLGEHFDAEGAVALTGASRYSLLTGPAAQLERALGQFMLTLHTQRHGYTEVAPPYIVSSKTMKGTGQLPRFADDLFRVNTDSWLIPTAEVPLTNLAADHIHDLSLAPPMRFTALTPCFRAEAGAAGRDTTGLIRRHQFMKVELVAIVPPEDSEIEFQIMVGHAEAVLRLLNLPYRVVELAAGDLGFSAAKTYDLEVWMPSQQRYVEISSISNCGDFQARRMKARYRDYKNEVAYLHTLNGSGVAVGRALAALLENHQTDEGGITVPAVLAPFLQPVALPETPE
ncbi:seryl-tRNA synthetase [Brevundimonas phage vB_BpoS-Kikimora]|uniref:Serine--tRNA ligase n=1 Tax=Brevundimonas phage vB_BpoS-Kikimora TaxID=2948601 RepID=A0A9E7SMT3_9CAUD|nr:seryl-tRNA synthetase [Brevundimonas phage vB_BpoS-Kikimora]